jgi:DNA-binding phage protein
MPCAFIIAAGLAIQIFVTAAGPPSDPALANKIKTLLHTVLTTADEKKAEVVRDDVRQIFRSRGLPTIAEVGNEPAYDFVLLASLGQPLDFQSEALPAIRKAAKLKTVPSDAAVFYQARYRLEKAKEQARKSAPTNPDLRDEIERLYKIDQAVRQQAGFNAKEMRETDKHNAAPLQAILRKYGVPTYAMVGVQAAKDFVIMAQHQTAKFRQEILPKLRANVDAGQADPDSYALVYDRAQRDDGKKQLYGTQLECKAGETMHEAPIEDKAHVDQRRAELGLMRVKLYARLTAEAMPQFCAPAAPRKRLLRSSIGW